MAIATRTNEDVKKDVVDQLYWDTAVDASDVKVEVSEGEVTLSGTVPSYGAYWSAEEDAWGIAGVWVVHNNLTIKYPPGAAAPTDAEIRENIEKVLLWHPDMDSKDIDAAVDRGWVTLRGTVDTYWRKIRAEQLITGLNGVLGITNELAVVPTRDVADKVIAEDIQAAVERQSNIAPDLIDITVSGGKVTITGSVPSLPAYRAIQRIAENTFGVVTVDNQVVIR